MYITYTIHTSLFTIGAYMIAIATPQQKKYEEGEPPKKNVKICSAVTSPPQSFMKP